MHHNYESNKMAHPDLDALLNALVPFAQQMLAEHQEFYPFAAALQTNGTIVHIGAHTGQEHPASANVMAMLITGLRDHAIQGKLQAAAICCDVKTIPPGKATKVDAINVQLEHASGESFDVYIPYSKNESHGYLYGDLFATKGTLNVFAN
jgi:hypothetical protein